MPLLKYKIINSIKKENNLNKLIVCGSGRTDINLLKQADLSLCLDTAPDYVKNEVDYVIHGNAETVLRIFDKIYHSKDVEKTIKLYNKISVVVNIIICKYYVDFFRNM